MTFQEYMAVYGTEPDPVESPAPQGQDMEWDQAMDWEKEPEQLPPPVPSPVLAEMKRRIDTGMGRGESPGGILLAVAESLSASLPSSDEGDLSQWLRGVIAYTLDQGDTQAVLYGQAADRMTAQETARADALARIRKRVDTQTRALAALQREVGMQSDLLQALESGDWGRVEAELHRKGSARH